MNILISIALSLLASPALAVADQDVLISNPHAGPPSLATEQAVRCPRRDAPGTNDDHLVTSMSTGLQSRTMLCLTPETVASLKSGTIEEKQMLARLRDRLSSEQALSEDERRDAIAHVDKLIAQ